MFKAVSLAAVLAASAAQSEELRVMNWNIANLASEVGVSLREGSHIRKEEDFLRIREIIAREDADIIALQEVGSIAAAQKAVGPEYKVTLESRCTSDVCAEDHGEIYTAIAYKADLDVSDIQSIFLDELALTHFSECGGPGRPVRGGVGLSFSNDGAAMVVMSVHLKASCADEASNDPIDRPDVQDDCAILDDQIQILGDWMARQVADSVTVVVAGDYNRKFLETGDRHIASLRANVPDIRVEPSIESQCWPRNYPQSRSFRTRKLYEKFGNPVSSDGTALRWTPYMPSSIGSRDFFLVAGPSADQLNEGREILLRPEALVHDPTLSLKIEERIAVETQAESFGVRLDEPSGYITSCEEPAEGELPEPKPFTGGTTVLGFQNVFPSDHCPIVIDFR